MAKKKIVFLTGTRADFGKLKPLINIIDHSGVFECCVFITGMHTLSRYGSTYLEVERQKYSNIYKYINQTASTPMDIVLSNTILGFSNYVNELKPDMIIVHGDRVEAFAAAIVGAFKNILVGHIEGGEISGTIDESIRHAITKLAHLHFVANEESKERLIRMGEKDETVFVIGSPDIDVMMSDNLPSLNEAKQNYNINLDTYSLFAYHPVTTELHKLRKNIGQVVSAIIESQKNYVVIYPNNDEGSDIIFEELERLKGNDHFKVFPTLRFEYFLVLLKHCHFIIGNSSAGIREAEVFGKPAINIGNRQQNRTKNKDIIDVPEVKEEILQAIKIAEKKVLKPVSYFGNGNSAEKFFEIIKSEKIFKTSLQKKFNDNDEIEP